LYGRSGVIEVRQCSNESYGKTTELKLSFPGLVVDEPRIHVFTIRMAPEKHSGNGRVLINYKRRDNAKRFEVVRIVAPSGRQAFAAVIGHYGAPEVIKMEGEVLGIKGARQMIIGRNMGFDDKIKTLRTLVNSFIYDQALAKKFNELAKRARKCGEARNIVAHTPFRASNLSDGVQFFPISASSRLETPEMDWSIDHFLTRIDDINQIDSELRMLESRMPLQRIAEALIRSTSAVEPKLGGLFTLGAHLADEEQ
jgi:hypothetical protein